MFQTGKIVGLRVIIFLLRWLMSLAMVHGMGVSDITGAHGGGPHVNFETLIPNPAKAGKMMVDQNFHIYLTH
jgi:hypothetical protein